MDILIMAPRVIQGFMERFPEVYHNAYGYFNYDNRVVEERVPRGDFRMPYQGPDDLTEGDYQVIVSYAQTLVDPILLKYNQKVALEDALAKAIRTYGNGLYDNKINANRYNVLLQSLLASRTAKKSEKAPEKTEVKPRMMKELGLKSKDIPHQVRRRDHKGPSLYKSRGKTYIEKNK